METRVARSDLDIPQLQPGSNVIPQLVNIIQTVKGWGAFSTFISPKISPSLKTNLSTGIEGAPCQKLYLENSTVENFLNCGDGFPRVKLPKISRLFDNNLSPGVGDAPSQKPISQKRRDRKFFRRRSCLQHIQMSQNQSFI
jgi:hypothetical protein